MANKLYEENDIQDIADAIREKNGLTDEYLVSEMAQAVRDIETSSPRSTPSDVNFYDYDGTLLYSYTATEAASLTELPEVPTHEGLTSEGWNWSLADLKAQITNMGVCEVGVLYKTSDDKTKIYINLDDATELDLTINLQNASNSTTTIDWGDNSTASTITGSGAISATHTYGVVGKYTIAISCTGNYYLSGGSSTTSILGDSTNLYRIGAQRFIYKIELASNCVRMGAYSLQNAVNLQSITMHSHFNSYAHTNAFNYCISLRHITLGNCSGGSYIGSNFLANCWSLKTISLPKTLPTLGSQSFAFLYNLTYDKLPISYTWTGHYSANRTYAFANMLIKTVDLSHFTIFSANYAFSNCTRLESIVLPECTTDGSTSYAYTFYQCSALKYVTFPSTVTAMGANTLGRCCSLKEIHMKSTNPPTITATTLSSNDASYALPTTCKIYVPVGSKAAYKAASNWSTYGSQIFEEGE